MFYGGGIAGLLSLALMIYAVFDVIATQEGLQRNLPKVVWLLIVIFVPLIGPIAWLLLGRPERAGFRPGDTNYRKPQRRPLGPDDSPDFLATIDPETDRLRRWEEDLKRREDELRRREEED
jgi:hypothetical protein